MTVDLAAPAAGRIPYRFGLPPLLLWVLGGTLTVRWLLAAYVPLTTDEAYFIRWGVHPAWGYYDHPPMVGWWMAALLPLGDAVPWLRLPAVLTPAAVGLGLYGLLRPYGEERAALAAAFYLAAPINVVNVLITTDTPLLLFAFGSVAALVRGLRTDRPVWFGVAGVALGLALLSKYFAVVLGLAYAVLWLSRPDRRRLASRFAWLLMACLPFIALNLYWNYTHCWNNWLFNLQNRHEDAALSLRTPALYALTLAYLAMPPALLALRQGRLSGHRAAETRLFATLLATPLLAFALMSPWKTVGLHWLLSFYPLFFLLAGVSLPAETLKKALGFAAAFAALHVVAVVAALAVSLDWWKASRHYDGIVLHVRPAELLQRLEPYRRHVWATDGYSIAALLAVHARRPVAVFGPGSAHARQDDLDTDFRAHAGDRFMILRKEWPHLEDYRPYFRRVRLETVRVAGQPYYLVVGDGFDYPAYRAGVLEGVRKRYYRLPGFMPRGGCPFCRNYFGDGECAGALCVGNPRSRP